MIKPRENEPRIEYLARVLYHLMHTTGACEYSVDYDEATCDGYCLAEDFINELNIEV